ncbi:hypothetical protein LPJ53_002035 [Coemansia erecta]|uniref:PAS domain-containing protein n=1 Tax=Coemansia erecta TaxID=147472 RepID=A0A9W7Y323_9FUNG|nr:hypothetical protein LPJ53_002035 [Coemansia erecta]
MPEASSDTQPSDRPMAYIAIHDKTPLMRVLYASSNIRQILQFAPSEVVGHPALAFVSHIKATDYSEQFGRLTNDTVLASHMLVDNRQGTPVLLRIIHFSCDNLEFNVALAVPHMPQQGLQQDSLAIRAAMAGSRASRVQACLVLESSAVAEHHSPLGPRVVFATRSVERVVGRPAEDIQGLGFMQLLAPHEVTRAALFLEGVAVSASVEYIVLRFAPATATTTAAATAATAGGEEYVSVEVLAAGSDDGALLLCRSMAAGSRGGNNDNDNDGYVSLDEIISSDAETSDISGIWRALR